MPRAFVLMTALPPTEGHLDLIRFASRLGVSGVTVLLNTQPDEPLIHERFEALSRATQRLGPESLTVTVLLQNEFTQQEPLTVDDDAFWENWRDNLHKAGFQAGDYIVASETYGLTLAKWVDGVYMPYDLDRWVRWTKGTEVRNDWLHKWSTMIPEFRKFLVRTVTIFGAESVGKTTLTRAIADDPYYGPTTKVFEWARPYLETVGPDITIEAMERIVEGQRALQWTSVDMALTPLIIQDTDLYSTLGYWRLWDPTTIPHTLYRDADMFRSHLYIILRSNIPFEADPLRYGGDVRETEDQYWVDICEEFGLNYVVLDENDLPGRLQAAQEIISDQLLSSNPIAYKREGAEYED